jgi:hypothetical protein
MSAQRVEAIIRYGGAIACCYMTKLGELERKQLHTWEPSDDFTRTDDGPGWAKYIGLRPVAATPKPHLVRRFP